MGFREVQTLNADVTFAIGGFDKKAKKDNPKQAEGYYLGKRVTEGGKYGPSTIYFLQTKKGNVGIWGKTDLNQKMAAVPAGSMIRVTHAGMASTPNGDMHKYKVEVDPDNVIDVSGLTTTSADEYTSADDNSADVEDSNFSTGYDESTDDEEDQAPEPVLPVGNRGSTAERRAKVEALLNKDKAAKN